MANRPEVCVGAIVVDRDRRLLLVERGRPPAAGQWSVPGGRVERGETLSDAVGREVFEETGLVVRCGELIGWVERIDEDHHFVILDFRAELDGAGPQEPTAGDDASAVAWIDLDSLETVPLVDGLSEFLRHHDVV